MKQIKPIVLKVVCTDTEGHKYPPLYLNNLEESLVLIWNKYDELEKVRKYINEIKWKIEDRQGQLRYGHLKLNEAKLH